MKWTEVIEAIMAANGGVASLGLLYQQASQYRSLPSGDWQKTLRGVLYREVRRGRYVKVGLGVYALPSAQSSRPARMLKQCRGVSPSDYLQQVDDVHSAVEGMLIEIGNYLEYQTYTSDRNRAFDGKRLGDLCRLQQVPPFTYSGAGGHRRALRCYLVQSWAKTLPQVRLRGGKHHKLRQLDAQDVPAQRYRGAFCAGRALKRGAASFEQRLKDAPF
jgi:hypothetical protein